MTNTPTPEQVAKALKGVTPGPWHVGQGDRVPFVAGNGMVRADLVGPESERLPNARFIAWARNNVEALAADRDAQRERAAAAEVELETSRLASGLVRMCVNCGKTRPADYGTSSPRAGCPSSDACTWDMTPQEAADHWRKVAHDRYEALAAEKAKTARLVEYYEAAEAFTAEKTTGNGTRLVRARAAIAEVQE